MENLVEIAIREGEVGEQTERRIAALATDPALMRAECAQWPTWAVRALVTGFASGLEGAPPDALPGPQVRALVEGTDALAAEMLSRTEED